MTMRSIRTDLSIRTFGVRHALNSERAWKIYGTLLGILLVGGILGLVLWMRHSAPCWIFPLAEAPSRCVVVTPR